MGNAMRASTKAKIRATIQAKAALKKAGEEMANCLTPASQPGQPVEDVRRNYEFHYRRGLLAAMECILRELR